MTTEEICESCGHERSLHQMVMYGDGTRMVCLGDDCGGGRDSCGCEEFVNEGGANA